MTKKDIIIEKALELLLEFPEGLRYSDLVKKILESNPQISRNTIGGTIVKDLSASDKINKPVPGFFIRADFNKGLSKETQVIAKVKEEDFYSPFADWIVNELEECTKAITLGGSKFKDKWGTPDVIGVREPRKSDIVKLQTEIVSAEIKINTSDLITAFGQACSYKLFSHKSYIVIPKNSSREDITRLDGLSLIFGIGLILFDSSNPKLPEFEIRTRASKLDPDMFYVNKYMKLIEDELFN